MFNFKVVDSSGVVVYDGPDKAAAFDALFGGGGVSITKYVPPAPVSSADVTIHVEGF